MKSRTIALSGLAVALVAVSAVFVAEVTQDPTDSNTAEAADDYLETFDSADSLDRFDFFVSNGRSTPDDRPTSWPGDHAAGEPCGGPTTTRTVHWPDPPGNEGVTHTTDPGETVYWCAPGGAGTGHIMTSFNTAGYAHVDFSPKQTFTDVRKVCWDQNVTNLGNRKWTQVVIVPKAQADAVAPRLDWTVPNLRIDGPAAWGLPLETQGFMMLQNQGAVELFTGDYGPYGTGWKNDQSVSDKAKRTTTCLTDLRNGEIEVSQERFDGTVDVVTIEGAFPAGDARVVFQDVSYNPDKSHDESPPMVADAYTWHWDNLFVSTSPNATPPAGGGGGGEGGGGGGGTPVTTPPPPSVTPSAAGQFDSLPPARLLDTRGDGATVDGQFARTGAIGSDQVIELQVAGRGGVSNDAVAAALNVTSVSAPAPGFLTLYACGEDRPNSSHLNYLGGNVVANLAVVPLDADGKVCIYASSASHVIVDAAGSFPTSSNYGPQAPARFLDTRADGATFDGLTEGIGRVAGGSVVHVPVADRGAIPADATAVVVNLGVVDPSDNGFLTAFPCGEDRPVASNLNYFAGRTVSNGAIVKVGQGGAICVYTLATTDIIVDVQGSFTDTDAFGQISPFRLLDTRSGGPTGDGQQSGIGRASAGSVTEIAVEGRAGIPGSAGAVALSLVVVSPGGPGFATIFPCGQGVPTASNLNYQPGDVTTNSALARIGADGKVCVFTLADADLVVDVAGWLPE